MASLMDILAGAGNLLDLPGSSLRDILSGRNPFDQWATPFSDGNRATGRDVLEPFLGANEETGMAGWMDNPMEGFKDVAGFGAEMLLDPLNLVPLGAVGKALKGRKAAQSANAATIAERGGKYAMVNPKVAGRPEVPTNPMLPEGIPELQPGFARAVHWASPENVDQIRESGLDYSRQGMLSSTAQVWGDGSKVNYSPPDDPRFSRGQAVIFDFPENELRLHDSIARSPGVLDPKYFVGAVPGPKPQPKNPMKLLGYTPDREVVYHGGHDWSASATPESPYGMFDVSRLRTGDGGNAFGPGAYFADAETTSRNYQEKVRSMLTRGSVEDPEILSEYFTPGRVVPSYAGQDQVVKFNPSGSMPGSSGWSVEVRSVEPGHTPDTPRLGPLRIHMTAPEKSNVYKALGRNPPDAKLYQLDMPPGSKDRFIDWESPMSQQPSQVIDKFDQIMGAGSSEGISKLKEIRSFYQTLEDDLTEIRRTKRYGFADDAEKARVRGMEEQVTALREQAASIRDDLLEAGVPRSLLTHDYLEDFDSGGGLTGFFLGKDPGQASISDTKILADAGLPGTKNLANSTGRNSHNYAIWDQNLLNQMRVRAIDGQRVPINPTTLVEQVQQPIARAADSPLTSTMNPMQLQAEPSSFPAAAAGAVYNALQTFNRHGGIQ